MKNNEELIQEEIKGALSVTLANGQTLDDLCMELIDDYNRDRFEAFAVRVYLGEETVITIFAIDKIRQEDSALKLDKIPVKKFKLTNVPLSSIIHYCQFFNCTLTTGNYSLDEMEVMSK